MRSKAYAANQITTSDTEVFPLTITLENAGIPRKRQKERGSGPVILKLQITVSLRCPVALEIEDKWNRLERMLLVGVANL